VHVEFERLKIRLKAKIEEQDNLAARDKTGKIMDQLITEFANLIEGRKKGIVLSY